MSDKVLTFTIRTEAGDSTMAMAEIERRLKELTKAKSALQKEYEKEGKLTKENQQKMKEYSLEIETLRQKKTALTKETRSYAKEAAAGEGTMAKLRAETARLRAANEQLNLTTAAGKRQFMENKKQMVENTKTIRDYDRSVSGSKTLVGEYGLSFKSLGRQLLMVAGLSGGLTAVFNIIKSGVKISIDFEKAMSDVKAVSGATDEQFKRLSESAIALGGSTKYTASQVASLQKEYSKLGFTADQILAMTSATLSLAAATGEDLARSATVAGATLRQFGLDATQMDMVVDVMAASFNASALDLNKFATSMQSVGPVANAVGVSLQRTAANLSVLANAGLDASVSGTSLRNIYLELERKGITWDQALDMLNNTTNKASLSLELFGKRGAVAGLVLAENRTEADAFTESYDNAAGSAKAMADIMEGNVAGSAVKLTSAWEGLILRTNDSNGALKDFLDTLTTVVSAINTKGKPAIDSLFKERDIESFSDKFKLFRDAGVGFSMSLVSAVFRGKEFAQEWSDDLAAVGDKMRETAAEESALEQKKRDEQKRLLDERTKLIEAQIEREEAAQKAADKARDDRIKAATSAREAFSKAQSKSIADQAKANSKDIIVDAEQTTARLIEIKQQQVAANAEQDSVNADFAKETNSAILLDKIASFEKEVEIAAETAAILGNMLTARKNRELSAAGDNAEKRAAIEKKYLRKEQTLSIAQAVINGALAITKATAQTGVLSPLVIPMIIASTLGQIGDIASQKFATGGKVQTGGELPGFSKSGDNTLALVKPGEVILNAGQQRSLGGSSTFRKIGVPGFADGGVVGAPVNVNPMDDMMGMARTIINGVNAKDVTLSIHKLREAEKELDTVIQRV